MIGTEIKALIIAELLKSEINDIKSMSPGDLESLAGKIADKLMEKFGLGL
jgi:hypothetical protein